MRASRRRPPASASRPPSRRRGPLSAPRMSEAGAVAILAVVVAGVVAASARPSVSHDIADSSYAQVELGLGGARTIDRTFRCVPVTLGGLRSFDVHVIPHGTKEQYLQEPSPGFAGISSGPWAPRSELVSIRARAWQRYRATRSAPGVYASTRRCVSSSTSVALSATGPPRAAGSMERAGDMLDGRSRTRASPRCPGVECALAAGGPYVGARSNVVEAALAMRSGRTGKPIAYIELDRSGKTTFWHSSHCT